MSETAQVPRRPLHAEQPQAGQPLPYLETPNSARQGRHSLQGGLASFKTAKKKPAPGSISGRCNIAAQTPWSFTTGGNLLLR